MEKIRIGFLGYGTRALDALMEHPFYEVKYFIVPRQRLCGDVYRAMERYKRLLKIVLVSDNRELEMALPGMADADCFLMNACPIILKQAVLDRMRVFNIHPGDLSYNRGHHPHLWTVLLGERNTKITLHSVCRDIDLGEVIKTVPAVIGEEDNARDVLDKLEKQIPMLLDALFGYLRRGALAEGIILSGGYRRRMEYHDYEIDLEKDGKEAMRRKINARSMHHGAFIRGEGKRCYVDRIDRMYDHPVWKIWKAQGIEELFPIKSRNMRLELDWNRRELLADTGMQVFFFHLSKIEEDAEEGTWQKKQ